VMLILEERGKYLQSLCPRWELLHI